jgi:hypothetical protein
VCSSQAARIANLHAVTSVSTCSFRQLHTTKTAHDVFALITAGALFSSSLNMPATISCGCRYLLQLPRSGSWVMVRTLPLQHCGNSEAHSSNAMCVGSILAQEGATNSNVQSPWIELAVLHSSPDIQCKCISSSSSNSMVVYYSLNS